MKCEKVSSQLSLFFDEALEADKAVQVSEHLNSCLGCRAEYDRLKVLRTKLRSLERVEVPDYLAHLLQLRLSSAEQDTWRVRLRHAWEYRLSRIRTTEGIWFYTRFLGAVTTVLFFIAIYSAMNPIFLDLHPQSPERGSIYQTLRQQLPASVLKNLGLIPVEASRKPISPSEPMINDLCLVNFGQTATRTRHDDTFSVVMMVDRSGTAKIQNVLEYPVDETLLMDFNSMIVSARCRPASLNGRAVDSRLVLTFSKISVYD